MMAWATEVFEQIVRWAILFMELIGVVVIVLTAGKAVVDLCRHDEHVRLNLAEGIALALEFKLGAEVLRTLVVRTLNELAVLGAVVLLRAAITVLILWGHKRDEGWIEVNKEKARINGQANRLHVVRVGSGKCRAKLRERKLAHAETYAHQMDGGMTCQ